MERHPIRKLIIPAGIAVGSLIMGTGYGAWEAATSSTEIQFGPHQAEADVNLNGEFNVDFGPLGHSVTPNHHNILGAKIVVKDIPTAPGSGGEIDYEAISAKYKQLGTNPDHVVKRAQHDIFEHGRDILAEDALIGLGVGVLAAAAAMNISEKRKQAIHDSFEGLGNKSVALLCLVGLAAGCLPSTAAAEASQVKPEVSHVFDGTPLEGTVVYGAYLQALVDRVAPEVISYVEDTTKFYDTARDSFKEQFDQKPWLKEISENTERVLVISDNHCNIGMDRVFGEIARSFGVKALIDGGDTTMAGTLAEEECVTSEADALPDIPKLLVIGNHDDPVVTGDQAKKHGFTVVDGTIQDFAGFKVLGNSDPRRSGVMSGELDNNDVGVLDLGRELGQAACQSHPDILLAHDPKTAQNTINANCAKLAISGHIHQQVGPQIHSDDRGNVSYSFVQGTSGGAKENSIILGPLKNPAVISVFEFNKQTRLPTGRYDIMVQTTGKVTISGFIPVPQQLGS